MRKHAYMLKEVNEKMNKFILKRCKCLVDSCYADGRETKGECSNSTEDKKCEEIETCPYKEVARHLLKVVNSSLCSRCDGCGYFNGCMDESCGTYGAYKCLDLLGLEFREERE